MMFFKHNSGGGGSSSSSSSLFALLTYQLLMGYLKPKFDSFVNVCNHKYIYKVPKHFFKLHFFICL